MSREFSYEGLCRLEGTTSANIDKSMNLYHIACVVQALLSKVVLEDKDSPIVLLAQKIIEVSDLQSSCEFNAIVAAVETYIIKNLDSIEASIIENAPELLCLSRAETAKDYYDHFMTNIVKYDRVLSEKSIRSALKRFKTVIAEVVMYYLSEEEIEAAFRLCEKFEEIKLIMEEVCSLFINPLFSQQEPLAGEALDRAKIVGKYLVKYGKLEELCKALEKKSEFTGFDKLLGLIESKVLDPENFSEADLQFIAKKLDSNARYYIERNKNLVDAIIKRIDLFIEKPKSSSVTQPFQHGFYSEPKIEPQYLYKNLLAALVEKRPAILETHLVDGYWDLSKKGEHLIKNAKYLNEKCNSRELLELFKSQDFPSEALDLLSYNKLKDLISSSLEDKIANVIDGILPLEEFSNDLLVTKFREAVSKHNIVSQRSEERFNIILYMIYSPKVPESVERALVNANYLTEVKKVFKFDHKFFKRVCELNIGIACELIKRGLELKDAQWLDYFLSNEADYIGSQPVLQNAIEEYINTKQRAIGVLGKFGENSNDKNASWIKSKSIMIAIIKSFSNIKPDLVKPVLKAEDLLQANAIDILYCLAKSDSGYIEGECKARIQYTFLENRLDYKVDEQSVEGLITYIKDRKGLGSIRYSSQLISFVKDNNAAFIKAGVDIMTLHEINLANTDNAQAAKLQLQKNEAQLTKQKQENMLEQKQIEAAIEELTRKRRIADAKEKADKRVISETEDEALKTAKNKSKAAAQEEENSRIAGYRLLTVDVLYNSYEDFQLGEKEYQYLTEKQKVDLLIEYCNHNRKPANYMMSKRIYEHAILKMGSDSLVWFLQETKEFGHFSHAVENFKISSDVQPLPEHFELDKDLEHIFYKGKAKLKPTLACDALTLILFAGAYFVTKQIEFRYACAAAVILPCVNLPLIYDKISYECQRWEYFVSHVGQGNRVEVERNI